MLEEAVCSLHSAPRTGQVQELPSYHCPIGLSSGLWSQIHIQHPESQKKPKQVPHTRPQGSKLSASRCVKSWTDPQSFGNPFSKKPPFPLPAETIICTLVVTNFHLKGQGLTWLSSELKDLWYPDVPLDCCTPLECCSLETPTPAPLRVSQGVRHCSAATNAPTYDGIQFLLYAKHLLHLGKIRTTTPDTKQTVLLETQ